MFDIIVIFLNILFFKLSKKDKYQAGKVILRKLCSRYFFLNKIVFDAKMDLPCFCK